MYALKIPMTNSLKNLLVSLAKRMDHGWLREQYQTRISRFFLQYSFPFEKKLQEYPDVFFSSDPVRTASLLLALRRLEQEQVAGAFAEVGVFRGELSRIIHRLAPTRKFYLFDTFQGFHHKDLKGEQDDRFRDTSLELVKKTIGNLDHVVFRVGFFPDTADGLEEERFAFVMLDVDKYDPTQAGLRFFYSRLVHGAYIFVHDFNSPESNWEVSRAVTEFMADKQEKLIELPDACGSVLFRKL
jgi:O-methyltransferase